MANISLPAAALAERLSLDRLNPGFEDAGVIEGSQCYYAGLALAGYLANVRSNRCVLLGSSELGYLASLDEAEARARLGELLEQGVGCLLVAADDDPPALVLDVATQARCGVYHSPTIPPRAVQPAVSEQLRDWLAPREIIHGVMMDVSGMGVLILGDSGIGKSECALELIKRGHRLVADDAVVLKRISDIEVRAEPPETLKHAMELRGIGLIDVRSLFGMGSISERVQVELVVRLEEADPSRRYERLGVDQESLEICGVPVPYLVIPIREGKNLSILVEVAAMNQHLRNLGVNTAKDITEDLERRLEEKARAR